MTRIILVGGGGHARVVGEAILACAGVHQLIGYVDRIDRPETSRCLGVPYLGTDAVLSEYREVSLVLGLGAVGVPTARMALAERLSAAGWSWATVVHPSAVISPTARLAAGAVVLPRAVVHADAEVGAHVVINTGAIVEHDVRLGAYVMVGPGAIVGGGAVIGTGAFIGLGAALRDHIEVGPSALVAMGAVVTGSVSAGRLVRGVPARDAGPSTEAA